MSKYEISYSQLVYQPEATTSIWEVLHGTSFVLGSAASIVGFAVLIASFIA